MRIAKDTIAIVTYNKAIKTEWSAECSEGTSATFSENSSEASTEVCVVVDCAEVAVILEEVVDGISVVEVELELVKSEP